MTSVSLRQFEVFVAVVDEGGFVAAADSLGITQSSVSHALASLERIAGGMLVERRQPATLTPFGTAVLDHARAALASARAFSAATASHRHDDAHTGTFSLAVSRTAARGLLPDLVKAWHVAFPNLEIDVYEGVGAELEDWLASGVVDAAILIDPARLPDGALLIATDTLHALVPVTDAVAARSAVRLKDLSHRPMLSCTAGCELYTKRVYAAEDVRFEPAQRIRDLTTLVSMVQAGLGISIVPSLSAALLPPSLTLVPVRPTIERRLYLSGPTDRPWHPAVAALLESTRVSFTLPLQR